MSEVIFKATPTLWTCLQVMLKDMEHSKKTLEEELQKTSEVRFLPELVPAHLPSATTHSEPSRCPSRKPV